MLTLHFDYVSAASAVAVLRLQDVADLGGAVRFAGIDVLGLGTAVPPMLDLLAEYEQWREAAAGLGLSMHRPTRRPVTGRAHAMAELADGRGVGAAWRWACLHAYWCEDADLGDPTVLLRLAAQVGLDPARAAAHVHDPEVLRSQRRRAAAQRRRGIGGVPVLEVDGTLAPADLPRARLHELAAL